MGDQGTNFLMIMMDDLGYADVSWNNPDIITPHLDQLANEGLVFLV